MADVDLPLVNQAVVVTGSSSGIGRAIALMLARAGADVLVHARANREGAQETAASIRKLRREARVELADLSEHEAQDKLVEVAWSWRAIDIWINNAGVDVLNGAAAQWSFEEKLAALWRVDVVATLRLSRTVASRMKARGRGVVINMGWDQAEIGMAGDSGEMFATTKGAVMSATRSLAKTFAPEVRFNCVAPGWIRTQWGECASEEWQQRAQHESLVSRWGTPDDVAHVVGFLASPAAAFVNGQIIPVNGGRV